MSHPLRPCEICATSFNPPHRRTADITDAQLRLCTSCRRIAQRAEAGQPISLDTPLPHRLGAPMRQIVFDLETWGLDRGWGVTMVASALIHGGPDGPIRKTMTLRDYGAWQRGIRSDDREIVSEFLEIFKYPGIIAYAHNGERFDVRWLRTVSLKYQLDMPKVRLIDPCQIAWKKYVLGRNSLEAVGDYLGIEQSKLHLPAETWRKALMDNDDAAWEMLRLRCESDVDMLNEIASRVTGDVGLIDYSGSYR